MLKKFCIVLVLMICLAGVSFAHAGEPTQQLKAGIDEVLALLKDSNLKSPQKKQERRDRIFKAVEERFDFGEMAKRSISEYWKQLSPAEQNEFQNAFSKLLENTYITKIEKYSDETVSYGDEKPKGPQNVLVSTTIQSKGQSIPLDYSLHHVNDRWMVYDVNIEGVSLVTNYRSQFREIMRKDGFKGLMSKIDEKLRKIEES